MTLPSSTGKVSTRFSITRKALNRKPKSRMSKNHSKKEPTKTESKSTMISILAILRDQNLSKKSDHKIPQTILTSIWRFSTKSLLSQKNLNKNLIIKLQPTINQLKLRKRTKENEVNYKRRKRTIKMIKSARKRKRTKMNHPIKVTFNIPKILNYRNLRTQKIIL